MDGYLKVTTNTSGGSPMNSFIADEVASICPLITPSPPTNDLINPLPDSNETNYGINEELVTILQQVKDKEKNDDSASSASSAEPACAQLLNHRNYFHIQKDEHNVTDEAPGKTQPLQLTFRNPPENYFFMSWNWILIRKISLWLFLSGLVAMVALVIAMISSLPKVCNPYTEWYQGSVIYEIFPASFSDSNHDMIGDFKGITQNSDYIMNLNVRAIRLNSIFATKNYPEDYENVISLLKIAPQLGTIKDFQFMVNHLKSKNISVILDLPLHPIIKQLVPNSTIVRTTNLTTSNLTINFYKSVSSDLIEEALIFWIQNGIDGFYLKNLEDYVHDPFFSKSLKRWKKIIGSDRPFIVSEIVLYKTPKSSINTLLSNVDLIDIKLELENGVEHITRQIDSIKNSTLFSERGMPWIQWSLSDVKSTRLANILPYGNGTLGATLLQLMLPGTPSIFYGNEIGLQQIYDPEGDRNDLKHLHQLGAMVWTNSSKQSVLSWMHGDMTYTNVDQIEAISKMIILRSDSPSIYINSVYKEGNNKPNIDVKYYRKELLVVQRWYPRRKSYVVVSNFGTKKISADLSTVLYSGFIVIGPRSNSKPGSISFKEISLWPGESVVILLD